MDFSKNIINSGNNKKPGAPAPPARKGRQLNKIPAAGGKRLGGSPDRINTLTGMKMKEERKGGRGGRGGRGGTRTMRGGSNTQVIHKPRKPAKKAGGQKAKPTKIEETKIQSSVNGQMVGSNTDHSKWRCKT